MANLDELEDELEEEEEDFDPEVHCQIGSAESFLSVRSVAKLTTRQPSVACEVPHFTCQACALLRCTAMRLAWVA